MKSRKPRLLIAVWLVAIASAFVSPLNHAVADPITTIDENGPDDQPGQKDLSSHTVDPGGLPDTIEVGWQWDVTSLSGNNTGDACALFDTDGDGKVNAALCVTIGGNPAQQTGVSPRIYTCGDDKVDRCTSPVTQVTNFIETECTTNTDADDPFHANQKDTEASCHVDLSEISATTAVLVNTCSYPSEQPNSDPSDCVLIPRDAFLQVIKNTVGNDGTFTFTLTPPGGTFATITTDPTTHTGSSPFIAVRSDVPITLAESVPTGWTLTSINCNGGSPQYSNPSVTLDLAPDQQVTCTFVDTAQNPSLLLDKTANVSTYSAVGQVITYSYEVTNNGNVQLAGPVTITDNITTNELCPAVSTIGDGDNVFDPNESITCTSSHTVTQADLNAGSITNVATASAGGTTSNQDTVTVTAVRNPALTIVKTATPQTYDSVGDVISYSFLVTNTGNVSLAAPVAVNDDKATDESCPAPSGGFLDPGESITCTASYTITQADLNSGSVTNIATATAGGVTSPPDTETVTAVRNAALTIVKTATPSTYDSVGDVISYSFLVTNTGNVSLAGPVTVSDDKATDESCPAPSGGFLDPGESITCTASYTITQADLNNGEVTNTATATADGTTSPPDSETVTAVKSPRLTLDKLSTETTYDAVGDVIPYSYVVTNTGNVSLAGPVTITDDKTTAACPNVNTVGNLDGFLDPNESITCTGSYEITQADLNNGSVTNHATATAGGTTSNQDEVTVNAEQNPALRIFKSSDVATYDAVGDVITYSYVVQNTGNVSLAGPVTIADNITSNEVCPAVTSVGNGDANLDPGEMITCSSSHIVTQGDLNAGAITNIATAMADGTTSPPDSVTVTALQNRALSLLKTATPATYDSVGDVISYSYLVTNSGNVSLAGPVTVTDDKATVTCPNVNTVGNLDGNLDPNESVTCTASYTITQADLNNGSVTNTATASANGTNSNPDTETVTAEQKPALTIVKAASPTTYDSVGDVINYTYTVTNSGNVRILGPVTVSDDVTSDEDCPAVSTVGNNDDYLDVGESITCTSSYTITQADLNSGSVMNTATASAGGTTSPPDSETVTAIQNRALTLVKSADVDTYDEAGDVINYSYLVTNSGNVSLVGPVSVSDDIAQDELCPNVNTVGNLNAFLDPGESITCTASHTVTQADLNNGSITNVATATAANTTSNPDTVTVTADQNPALTISKTADVDTYDSVGDVINYEYVVRNTGNVSLAGPVTIDDDITSNETCPAVTTVGNEDELLDPGESITCTSSYTITQADLNNDSVTNAATATAGGTTSPPDTVTVPADQNPSLKIEKSADVDTYDAVGDVINYSYVVTNDGNVSLAGSITVSDDITTNESCPAVNTVGNEDELLDPGESITCMSSHTITQADLDHGSVTNAATASNGTTTSPPDTVTVPADQNPSIEVEKTGTLDVGDDNVATPGDEISYTITAKNTGNVTLDPVAVDDPLFGEDLVCDKTSLVPNETATCTGTHVLTQADIDAGSVSNTATGTGTPPTGDDVTDTDTEVVTIGQIKDMSVVKATTSGTFAEGDNIIYTITVRNTGNVTLTGVSVSDPVPAQTTFVSCGPAGTCSENGGTVTWTIASIAPGQSVEVTLTVRVGAITACEICNTAHAIATQLPEPGRDSQRLCIQVLPADHPELAHASGSALGARVNVLGLINPPDFVPVSSSQSVIGTDGAQDSVLSLAVPPPGGAVARAGLITTTTSSTVSDAPARAMNTSTAETLGVNLLNGVVTADVVRAVGHAEANGIGSFESTAGSTFANLKVSGVTMANVAPNTTVNLPALLFGKGSYVKLYEKVASTSKPAQGQLSGGTYAADVTVNMIHVYVRDSLPLIPGNQTTEIIVSGATAHADFPQTTVCAVQPARSVSGHAFIASVSVTVDDPEDPELLGIIEGFSGIPASGGHDHQELPSVVLTEPDGEVLNTEDVSTDSAGNIFGPTITASSYAQAANVCLLEMAGGCTVRATLVKSQSNSSAASSGPPGAPTSNATGTTLVDLSIGGTLIPLPLNPAPNTVINIPGVGFIILNEQFCDGGGTLAAGCTDGLHSGLTVRAIRIVVTLLNPLGIGAEVIVAEAHSDVTRPPYTAVLPGTGA